MITDSLYNITGHNIIINGAKDWLDPLFVVDSNDWACGITYDDIKEDIRYSVIINYEMTGTDKKHITIRHGRAFRDSSDIASAKEFTMVGEEYSKSFFLNYENGNVLPSSIEKFVSTVKRLINLKVFL